MKYWLPFSFLLIPCSAGNDDLQPPQLTAVFLAVVRVLAFRVPGVLCVLFVSVLFPYALFLDDLFHVVQPLVSPSIVFLSPFGPPVPELVTYVYDQ